MENRTDRGTFTLKGDSERQVRSIRATDRTWDDFGFEADKRRITRADLLEQWVRGESIAQHQVATPIEVGLAVAILNDALALKANSGGAIKAEIRKALELLT